MDNICTKDYRAEQVACNSAFVLVGSDILDSDLGCGDPSWSNLLHVRSFQSVNSGTSKFCEGNLGTPDVVVRSGGLGSSGCRNELRRLSAVP